MKPKKCSTAAPAIRGPLRRRRETRFIRNRRGLPT
jgi:hypothetical protein